MGKCLHAATQAWANNADCASEQTDALCTQGAPSRIGGIPVGDSAADSGRIEHGYVLLQLRHGA